MRMICGILAYAIFQIYRVRTLNFFTIYQINSQGKSRTDAFCMFFDVQSIMLTLICRNRIPKNLNGGIGKTKNSSPDTNEMIPIYFYDHKEFRKWLDKNCTKESELLVGYYKVGSGKPSMTWSQSVDEALCFGWIDGIRRSIDEERYCIRFTPRRPTSIWSNINIQKVEMLQKKGLMTKPGLEAFNSRKNSKSGIYSFENNSTELNKSFEKTFRTNKDAWDFFIKQAPSFRKTITHWIMSARLESTQLSRLTKTINASEKHIRIF